MQRGYIIALALAPFAAVFLQGCNHPAAAPITEASTTLTAPVPAGTTVLQVANTAGFIANSKVTIADPTTGVSETNVIKAIGSIELMVGTENAYGVSTTVTMDPVGAGTITSIDAVRSSIGVVTGITPAGILHNVQTTFTLLGTAKVGDLVSFANTLTGGCNTSVPNLPVVAGVNGTGSMGVVATMPAAGVYVACIRQAGKTDSAQQTTAGVQVDVAANPAYTITAILPPVFTNGKETKFVTQGTIPPSTKIALITPALVNETATACPAAGNAAYKDLSANGGENPETTIAAPGWEVNGKFDVCAELTEDSTTTVHLQLALKVQVASQATCGAAAPATPPQLIPPTYQAKCIQLGQVYNAGNSTVSCEGAVCGTAADIVACCNPATARLYAVDDVDEKKPEGSSNTMLTGAGSLLLVTLAVVGIKMKRRSDANGLTTQSQDDQESSLETPLE